MPSRWPSTGTRASACDARDQRLAAARDDQVDGAVEPVEHQPDRVAIGGRHDLDAVGRQARFLEPRGDRAVDGERSCAARPSRRAGSTRCPSAAQIAAASAVTLGRLSKIMPITPIGVRTRAMSSPFGPLPARHLGADRIGQGGDLVERRGDRLEPRLVEPQPVDQAASPRPRRSALAAGPRRRGRAAAAPSRGSRRVRVSAPAHCAAPRRARPAPCGPSSGHVSSANVHDCTITRSSRWIKLVGPAIAEQRLDPARWRSR